MEIFNHPTQFSQTLLTWFDQYGRKDLPWQKNINPYCVWVSEIMLQQTQVKTVIPYFQRFIDTFPTVEALANASIDEVLRLWAGLGYYARGRNLHRAAQLVIENYAGKFPSNIDELQMLPGVGRSTAGAILSIAFKIPTPILDGNVKRVLTRIHGIQRWPGELAVTKQLWDIATAYTPKQRVADYTQAIMDLGATLCTRSRPRCHACPFQNKCIAYQTGQQQQIPVTKPAKVLPVRSIKMLLLYNGKQEILLERRPPVGIWGGLWSLPECPLDADIKTWCKQNYGYHITDLETWQNFRHTFSHFHLDIIPLFAKLSKRTPQVMDSTDKVWYKLTEEDTHGLASPIKRLISQISQRNLFNVT